MGYLGVSIDEGFTKNLLKIQIFWTETKDLGAKSNTRNSVVCVFETVNMTATAEGSPMSFNHRPLPFKKRKQPIINHHSPSLTTISHHYQHHSPPLTAINKPSLKITHFLSTFNRLSTIIIHYLPSKKVAFPLSTFRVDRRGIMATPRRVAVGWWSAGARHPR